MTHDDANTVLVERRGAVGHLKLNRLRALNSLDAGMIAALHDGLMRHVEDTAVSTLVVSSANERAFCAGGDMRFIRRLALADDYDGIARFFDAEYTLNLAIAECPKPYVALIDGIAMGGGLGVSVHGSHRIVTERARLAMPEARIGFFADVGGSHFLPRLARRAGYWMALTATAVDAATAVDVGLATHHVDSAELPALLGILEQGESDIDTALASHVPASSTDSDDEHAQSMQRCLERREAWFSDADLDAIESRLAEAAGGEHDDDNTDAGTLLDAFRHASPYSQRLTLSLFDGYEDRSLADALVRERTAAREAVRHPDLVEGVRAVLEDRESARPAWASR